MVAPVPPLGVPLARPSKMVPLVPHRPAGILGNAFRAGVGAGGRSSSHVYILRAITPHDHPPSFLSKRYTWDGLGDSSPRPTGSAPSTGRCGDISVVEPGSLRRVWAVSTSVCGSRWPLLPCFHPKTPNTCSSSGRSDSPHQEVPSLLSRRRCLPGRAVKGCACIVAQRGRRAGGVL